MEATWKQPTREQLTQVMGLINPQAVAGGYDPTAAMIALVEAYNQLWRTTPDAAERKKLGAVGFFPQSKPLSPDDKGAVMALVDKRPDGNIYVDLGQLCVNWFALTPELARTLAERLLKAADAPPPVPDSGHPRLPGLP